MIRSMKFLQIKLLILLLLSVCYAQKDSNWYLGFFNGNTEMYAKYFNTDGVVIEEASGTIVQKLEADGGLLIKSALVFKNSGDKAKSKSVLKKTDKENVYSGSAEDAEGNKFTILTEILPDNKYKTVVTGEEGYSVAIVGELKEDGKVYAKENIYDGEEITSTSEVIFSKKGEKAEVAPEKAKSERSGEK